MQKRPRSVLVVGVGNVGRLTARVHGGEQTYRYDPPLGLDELPAGERADRAYVCVPTPEGPDGQLDLSLVRSALAYAREHVAQVYLRSTVPVGTCRRLDVDVYFPCFMREAEMLTADDEPQQFTATADGSPRFEDLELAKLATNAFLALSVSFANEMRQVGDRFGADWRAAQALLRMDPRIGVGAYLDARGPWGGHCFPKDVTNLIAQGADTVVASAFAFNETLKREILE